MRSLLDIALALFLLQAQPGSIQGVVANATGEPLSKAIVELQSEDGAISIPVFTTAADGKFAFRSLPPGRYKLSVNRAGFVRFEHKTIIDIAPGQQITDLRPTLKQTGTIHGRIVDRTGQPLANVTVRALRSVYEEGRASLKTEQTAITNDLGGYRLFWLPPGSYFVSALPYSPQLLGGMLTSGTDPKDIRIGVGSRAVAGMENIQIGTMVRPILERPLGAPGPNETYVPTYFPGTTDEDRATPVRVEVGAVVGSIDIAAVPVETHHIRGVVINGITRQPGGAILRRARASALNTCQQPGMDPDCAYVPIDYEKGTFDIGGITAGSHILYAMDNDLVAQAVVEVRDSDIENLVLTLMPGITITGKVVPAVAGVEVRLRPGPPVTERAKLAGTSLADGTFSIRGLTPGDYQMAASSPKGTYIKSVPTKIGVNGQSDPLLQITVGLNPGTIEGRAPVDSTIVLLPDAGGFERVTKADASGNYRMMDIAPGDYKLIAVDDDQPVAWRSADYRQQGKSVRVMEGETQRLDVGRN